MPLGGKFGVVNGQGTVRQWQINDNQEVQQFVASNTKGGTGAVPGVENWEGSFGAYGGQPAVLPGAIFAFEGYTAPNDGLAGNGTVYSGQALLSELTVNWNWEGGEIINNESSFMGHLALLAAEAAQLFDTSDPDVPKVCGTKVEYSVNGTDWTELGDLTTAALTLSVTVNDYVNSSTNCNTGRDPGPKNWTAALTQQSTERVTAPQKGNSYWWRFWIDNTVYWQMKFGIVRDFTNITVDRETGAIIAQTVNLDMNVWDGTTLGEVAAPDGTLWYDGAA